LYPFPSKKLLNDLGALGGQNASFDLDLMIQFAMIQHPERRTAGAGFWVARSKHHAPQSRLHYGSGAHRTRFDCNIEIATHQPVVAQLARCAAQHQYFRMGGRIKEVQGTVVRARHHPAFVHQDRPHRHLSLAASPCGFAQSNAHEPLVQRPQPTACCCLGHLTILARGIADF